MQWLIWFGFNASRHYSVPGPIKLPPNISSCALLTDLRSPWLAEENPRRAQVEREENYKIEGF